MRASKTVDGVATKFVWDNDQNVMEADVNNNVTNIYSFGINRICSTNTATNANQYYIYNPHGDVQGLTDVNGT